MAPLELRNAPETLSTRGAVSRPRARSREAALALVLLSAAACGDYATAPSPHGDSTSRSGEDSGQETTSLNVTPGTAALSVGDVLQLRAVDERGDAVDDRATWMSSDGRVASVSSSGVVEAKSVGTTTIRVDIGRETATATVTITSTGIWIGAEELASKPTRGPGWNAMKAAADTDLRGGSLTVRDDHNVRVMAAALVAARLDSDAYRARVRDALAGVMAAPVDASDGLAASRRLGTYAISADLIGLDAFDPDTAAAFRGWLRDMMRYPFEGGGGGGTIIDYHERRPNNFGTHAGASRMAVAAYLGDDEDFERAVTVFRGWLGDRSAYADFSWGEPDWQCDASRPVGINPKGCSRSGRSIDGVLPDDQRRSGGFAWPPPKENYVYEALQGAMAMAVMAHRRGHPAFEWSDQALLRAFRWLYDQASYRATGDDTWQVHVINRHYGARFPSPGSPRPGKNVGWTDWTN